MHVQLATFKAKQYCCCRDRLTVEEVIRLLRIVKNNPLWYVEARIEEVKKMLNCLEAELEEQKNTLFCYNEKIESAKQILIGWEKASKNLGRKSVESMMKSRHCKI